ncbi:GntR family transcriptional regulator, partial [Corallococcus aberystwythensis]
CANASAVALGPLESTCYALQDAARWYHPKERCAQLEFELLRLCAQVASRPGHVLLIQSLQRAFRGIADRLLPFMGGDVMRQWVICALDALYARDVQALQQQLPALMKTYDELVLDQLAPVAREQAAPEVHRAQEGSVDAPAAATSQDDAPEARSCIEEHSLGAPASVTEQDDALEARHCVETRELGNPTSATGQDEAFDARLRAAEHGLGALAPAARELPPSDTPGKSADEDVLDAALGDLSDCRTDWGPLSPEEGLQPEPPPVDSQAHSHHQADGLCASDASMAHSPEPPAS